MTKFAVNASQLGARHPTPDIHVLTCGVVQIIRCPLQPIQGAVHGLHETIPPSSVTARLPEERAAELSAAHIARLELGAADVVVRDQLTGLRIIAIRRLGDIVKVLPCPPLR